MHRDDEPATALPEPHKVRALIPPEPDKSCLISCPTKAQSATKSISRQQPSMMTSRHFPLLLLLLVPCLALGRGASLNSHHSLPTISMARRPPVLSSSDLMDGLRRHGAVVFTDLGEEYVAAVGRMAEKAPACLDGALQV